MNKNLKYYQSLPYRLRIIPYPIGSYEPDYFTVEYIGLRGCKAEGNTEEEAIKNVQELFDEYIEARIDVGDDIPEPDFTLTQTSSDIPYFEASINCK